MKIGIFGGSFDPITNAHLILAEIAREEFKLDRIDFTPTYQNPLKKKKQSTDEDRLRMINLAISCNKYFHLSNFDINGKYKNSIDTINSYNLPEDNYSEKDSLYFIMGSDCLQTFIKWKSWKKILENTNLVVGLRERINYENALNVIHCDAVNLYSKIKMFDLPFNGISSTDVRERIKKGKSIKYLVPEEVERYIHIHKLYGGNNASM